MRDTSRIIPERLEDYITESSPVRVIDVVADELDLDALSFRTTPEVTVQAPLSRRN
jgi:hypothetical protein